MIMSSIYRIYINRKEFIHEALFVKYLLYKLSSVMIDNIMMMCTPDA